MGKTDKTVRHRIYLLFSCIFESLFCLLNCIVPIFKSYRADFYSSINCGKRSERILLYILEMDFFMTNVWRILSQFFSLKLVTSDYFKGSFYCASHLLNALMLNVITTRNYEMVICSVLRTNRSKDDGSTFNKKRIRKKLLDFFFVTDSKSMCNYTKSDISF